MCFVLFRLLCGQRIRLTSLFRLSLAQIPWCLHNQPQKKNIEFFKTHFRFLLSDFCLYFPNEFRAFRRVPGIFFFFFQAKTNLHIPIARRMRARPFQPEGSFTITLLVETYWFWFAYAMSRWIEQRKTRSKKTRTRGKRNHVREHQVTANTIFAFIAHEKYSDLFVLFIVWRFDRSSPIVFHFDYCCCCCWFLSLFQSVFCIICWFYNFITHDCERESDCGEAALRPNT